MTPNAQLNIGRFRYPTDDPRMAEFMDNLDRINALAERSEGFVWRLKDDSNNATAIRPATIRPWRSTCRSGRASRRSSASSGRRSTSSSTTARATGSRSSATPHFVMWPIPAGHIPDLAEAKARLEHLRETRRQRLRVRLGSSAAYQAMDEPEMRMSATSGPTSMRIESQKHRLDVRHADLSGSRFDDVNLSGSRLSRRQHVGLLIRGSQHVRLARP